MTTVRELQQQVDEWITTHGVRYFNELTNLGMLIEEVGELSRHIVRQYGEQSYKSEKKPGSDKDALSEEMGDVLFVLVCLANQTGIDLEDAMRANLNKKSQRDSDRHTSNPKLS